MFALHANPIQVLMCPKRLATRRIRLQPNLKVSYRENTNTWVTASPGDCTELTWLALRMKEQPTIPCSTLQRLQKTTFRARRHSLAVAAMFPLLKDKLAVVSDILNEGYHQDLHPYHPALLHSITHYPAQEWGINGFVRASCPSVCIMERRLATCSAHALFRPAVSTFTLYGDNSGISHLWHPTKGVLLRFLASSLFWYLLPGRNVFYNWRQD